MKIEIWARDPRGGVGRLNEFRGENATAVSDESVNRLRRIARSAAERWSRTLPEDDIEVREDRGTRWR